MRTSLVKVFITLDIEALLESLPDKDPRHLVDLFQRAEHPKKDSSQDKLLRLGDNDIPFKDFIGLQPYSVSFCVSYLLLSPFKEYRRFISVDLGP